MNTSKVTTAPEHLKPIETWLQAKGKWLKTQTDEKNLDLTLSDFLLKELERSVDLEDRLYAKALSAQTPEQQHDAILKIMDVRAKSDAEEKAEFDAAEHGETVDEDDEEEALKKKEPRKKGWVERKLDEVGARYITKPTDDDRSVLVDTLLTMEVGRRVRYYYDIQKLRIAVGNRFQNGLRLHGDTDHFIEYQKEQLERMERHCERTVDATLRRSPDCEFYGWLIDNHVGIGVMMAACLVSELGSPERFRTVSALWKYAGLAVVGHDENGLRGHAQARTSGQVAQWNHFLRTKMLGVMAPCMIKAQTKYMGTPDEATKGRNVKVLRDYKLRIQTRNNLVSEKDRYYSKSGREIFAYRSEKQIPAFKGAPDGTPVTIAPSQLQRRSPAHINKMAVRYMVKMFTIDALTEWRRLRGMPAIQPWNIEYLRDGRRHGE